MLAQGQVSLAFLRLINSFVTTTVSEKKKEKKVNNSINLTRILMEDGDKNNTHYGQSLTSHTVTL